MVELIGATALLGAILLPVNYRLQPDEIAYVLADGAPVVIVAGADYHDAIAAQQGSLPSVRYYFGIGPAHAALTPLSQLSATGAPPPSVPVDGDAGFMIIHTAAVGGRPRGALLSQMSMLTAQSSLVDAWRLDERDVSLGMLPLFHVAGLGLMLTTQQAGGASAISAKFDAAQAARDIESERITVMSEFAPMLGSILDQARSGQLSSLRAVTGLDYPRPSSVSSANAPMRHSGSRSVNRKPLAWQRCLGIAIVRSPLAGRYSGEVLLWWMATIARRRSDILARSSCVARRYSRDTGISKLIPHSRFAMAGITPAIWDISMLTVISGMLAACQRKN
jgi:acyl-CoA synthetase (AMP-forming)/AMP-acid ligase II